MATAPQKVKFRDRIKQIGMVFSFTAKRDRLFIPLVLVGVIVPLAAGIVLSVLGFGWSWLGIGVLAALLAVMIILNLRSNKAMMIEAEGTPGAAAQIIENMRGDWRVTPGMAATTQMDFVHLIIG